MDGREFDLSMPGLPPAGESVTPLEKPKRKRRKATKSCAFCRKRKLRCDQKRPICSTCQARKFTQCIYVNELDNGNGKGDAEVEGPSLDTLTDDLQKMENDGEHVGNLNTRYITFRQDEDDTPGSLHGEKAPYQIIAGGTPVNHSKNLLSNFFTLQCKESGRRIFYGATSFKTFMAKYNWELMQRFFQAWTKLKRIRKELKRKGRFSMLKELTTVEEPLLTNSGLAASIISEVIEFLPSSEKIESSINQFFDQTNLFIVNGALDRRKVLRDFQQGFHKSEQQYKDGESPVVALIPSAKKNYYKIGIVVMILALTHYRDNLPLPIERFLIFLTGTSTAKTMYVERTQFLLLRCHYRSLFAQTGGDNSHLMLLVDNMINTAIYLGLNQNIRSLYEGQENVVGSLESLQRLWYWIMFADLDVSLNLGRPLKVSPYDYDDNEMLSDHSKTLYGVLKRFLKVTRPMLFDLHYQNATPNLKRHCDTLIDFIEQEFPPLDSYSSNNDVTEKGFVQTRVLCQALSFLMTFYGLRFFALKEINNDVKNGGIKSILTSCSLCVKLILYCFELDKVKFPEMVTAESKATTPYLNACMSHMCTVFIRAIGMFYAFAYSDMTFFENGLLLFRGCDVTTKCDLSTLRSDGGQVIAFATYFKLACENLDLLTASNDPVFRRLLRRSQSYVILLGLATVMRTVIQTALRSRTQAENSWLSNSQKRINVDGKTATPSEVPQFSGQSPAPFTNEESSNLPDHGSKAVADSQNCFRTMPENDSTLTIPNDYNVDGFGIRPDVDLGPEGFPSGQPIVKLSDQMESEMTQLIEQEFWGNYNMGWRELLDNTDLESVFPDFLV